MRWYVRLLIALGAALLGAWAWHILAADPGYVLITFAGWSVESTLIVAALAVALAVLLLRLLVRLIRAPFRGWRRHRRRVARARLATGLVALQEGRWAQAEKSLLRAAADPAQRGAAWLYAAEAALAQGQPERAARYLDDAAGAGQDAAVLSFRSGRQLAAGASAAAQALLGTAARSKPLPPKALHHQVLALCGSGRAVEATGLLAGLRSSKVLGAEAFAECERSTWRAALEQAEAFDALNLLWNQLARAQRAEAALAGTYARRAAELGEPMAAVPALEFALDKHWDEDLAVAYGRAGHERLGSAIKRCERWAEKHPDSAGLQLALGQLCRREKLWGKAEQFLQAALPHRAAETWEALAELAADRGDPVRAQQALRNALKVARGEPAEALRALPALAHERAEREERDAMGLPKLPAATES